MPRSSQPAPIEPAEADAAPESSLSRAALRFTAWAERWVPDAFVFALVATVIVFALGVAVGGASPVTLAGYWGSGFWGLAKFTLQMALIIVTGYVLASSRPVFRVISRLACLPRTARGATVMVALFAMTTSWLNWGFSLIFSAMLAKETARHRPEADYRAIAASSFLGLGSIWAQGLSGSAALQMASKATIPEKVREVVGHDGLIPRRRDPRCATRSTSLAKLRRRRDRDRARPRRRLALHAGSRPWPRKDGARSRDRPRPLPAHGQ